MASTGILCSVFLLVTMKCITSAGSAESDEYIFGNEEDKFLLPFLVILLLVISIVALVVAIVMSYFILTKQSNRKTEIYHMNAPAKQAARLSSFHYSERKEVPGDRQYEPDLGSAKDNWSFGTLRFNGVGYDNPVVLDNEDTDGYAKKANDSSGDSGKRQENVGKKVSFNNPAYNGNVNEGSNGAEIDYRESVGPRPMQPSSVEECPL